MVNAPSAGEEDSLHGLSDLKSRLLRGGAWVVGGRAAAIVAGVASNALLARLLPPSEVGIYFLTISVTTTAAVAFSFGLPVSVVRFTADAVGRGDEGRARRAVLAALLFGAAGTALGGMVLTSGLGQLIARQAFGSTAMASIMPLAALWLFVSGMLVLVAEAFRGLHDIRQATIFGSVIAPATTAASLVILSMSGLAMNLRNVLAVMIGIAAAALLAGALLLLRRLQPEPPRTQLSAGELLTTSAPLWISTMMLTIVSGADLWIVGAYLGSGDVALYGAASRLAGWLSMPLTLVNAVVPPMIATLYASGRRRELQALLQATAAAAALPALALMAVVAGFSGDVLALIFGEPYRAGATIALLLTGAQAVNVFSGSCATTLMMTGHQQMAMAATVLSSVVTVSLALALVGSRGTAGVAFAAACGLVLQNVSAWWLARRWTGLDTHASIPQLARMIRGR